MQNWKDLYLEHATMISEKISEIRWIDLWQNQVNFLTEEHPFPTPAAFLSYRTLRTEDFGNRVQKVTIQVDVYLYYETFADSYKGAFNQESALGFIDLLDKINALFHSTSGVNFSNMRRLSFAPVDTGNAGNLYRVSFECTLMDYSALQQFADHEINEIDVVHDKTPFDLG